MRPTPCRVSDVSRLEDASLSFSSLDGWDHRGRLDDFLGLARRCWRTRAYGDFWSYMLVAEGAVDLAAEPELELHDMAALDVIVREAGGRFTSLDGRDGPNGGNALASNGILHESVLGFLGSVGPPGDAGEHGRAGSDDEQHPARVGHRDHQPGGTVFDLRSRRRPPQSGHPSGQPGGPDGGLPPLGP